MVQYAIVGVVVCLALIYALRHAYLAIKFSSDHCYGCALREACNKNHQNKKTKAERKSDCKILRNK